MNKSNKYQDEVVKY